MSDWLTGLRCLLGQHRWRRSRFVVLGYRTADWVRDCCGKVRIAEENQ